MPQSRALATKGKSVTECPVCKITQTEIQTKDHGEKLVVECRRCGRFKATRNALTKLESLVEPLVFSAWLRSQKEMGSTPPELHSRNIENIVKTIPDYSVSEKQLLLLKAVERRSEFPGSSVQLLAIEDHVLNFSITEEEFKYHIDSLVERKLVHDNGDAQSALRKLTITPNGWNFLSDANSRFSQSSRCFVAMSFSQNLYEVWTEAIKPAIECAGFYPHRTDQAPHNERIDVKIMADIKESRFVVADVTEQKAGVYFEAGYAMGMGVPVIWSVSQEDLDNVHFDTRQYCHIVWESNEDFKQKLEDFILAIIGRGCRHG